MIENFISVEKCKELIDECEKIVSSYSIDEIKKIPAFDADETETKVIKIRILILGYNTHRKLLFTDKGHLFFNKYRQNQTIFGK